MKWFGKPSGAPYEEDGQHVETPVGMSCQWCDEAIKPWQDGFLIPTFGSAHRTEVAMHYECEVRSVIGGLNHMKRLCLCCGGTEQPDPPWLTRREAAIYAYRYWASGQREAPLTNGGKLLQ